MRLHLVVLTAFVALLACARQPAKPSPEELARGQHLTRPFAPPGRCVGKPSQCVSDGQCAPPFSLCQEGTCCSGELDPATCACNCGGGPACGPGEFCCPLPSEAIALGKSEEDRGLKCRPVRECFGEG
jgi:hypothetical protein